MKQLRIKAIDFADLKANENCKPSKYRNQKTLVDGIEFDSKGEANRYSELKYLERGNQISDLRCQVAYELRGLNGAKVCKYILDFEYVEKGKLVVEDFKGLATAVYKLKAKLFRDNYPDKAKLFRDNYPDIELREVRS